MQNAKKRAPEISMRTVRKACYALNTGAAPGPSGTTNKVIAMIHECRDGPYQLKRLAELWVGGLIRPNDAARWTTTILTPIKQGWKQTDNKYNIRPVGLMECLLKHAESIIVQHRIRNIREKLEPQALSLAPEGILATIKILRSWAHKADGESASEIKSDDEDYDEYVDNPEATTKTPNMRPKTRGVEKTRTKATCKEKEEHMSQTQQRGQQPGREGRCGNTRRSSSRQGERSKAVQTLW